MRHQDPHPQYINETLRALKQGISSPQPSSFESALLAEVKTFERLQALDSRIEKALSRKRMEIQEMMSQMTDSITATLRVFIEVSIDPQDAGQLLQVIIHGKVVGFEGNLEFTRFLGFTELVKDLKVDIEGVAKIDLPALSKAERHQKSDGFSIIRPMPEVDKPAELKVNLTFTLDHATPRFKPKPCFASFLGAQKCSRREATEAVYKHAKTHQLLEKGLIKLDSVLREALDLPSEQASINMPEISGKLQRLLEPETIVVPLNFGPIEELGSKTKGFDTLIELPLDEAREALVFFLPKFIAAEMNPSKDKKSDSLPNEFVKLYLRTLEIDKTISRKFEKIYRNFLKHQNYVRLEENPSLFIQEFLAMQKRNVEIVKNYSVNNLQKRVWSDENEFFKILLEKYDDVAMREIDNYLVARDTARQAT